MSKVTVIAARVLLGLPFCVFGANGFWHFMPQPPLTGKIAALMGGMAESGYLLPLIFGTQIVGGLLVLSGRLAPLGLALLAPVLVNILCFHAALDPKGIVPGLVMTVLEIYLAWAYRGSFRGVLTTSAKPT